MRILIIIPANNEQETLTVTLNSLQRQQFTDFQVCVVDDGSQDATFSLAKGFAQRDFRFQAIQKPVSAHAPGSKVVRAFESGLALFDIEDFGIICKFDADIVFPENYLLKLAEVFQNSPTTIGLAGGLVYITENKAQLSTSDALLDFTSKTGWKYEAIAHKRHVRGPIKAYSTRAFLAMNGLRAVLGWDNLDEILLQKAGFTSITLPEVWVKHLRPTGSIYQKDKLAKMGSYFRNLGLDLPLAMAAAGKEAVRQRSFSAFFMILKSYLQSPQLDHLSEDEIRFIRRYRYIQLFQKFFRS